MSAFEYFKIDFHRMTGIPFKLNLECILLFVVSHQIRYMYWWRKYKQHRGFFAKYKLYRYGRKYGLEISNKAQIGKGLYLGHPYNITVGAGAVMGNNVNLHKGSTIGRENRGKRIGSPKLGNNIYVGINATIVGNVRIGNNVMIAPNSFVNFDVPDNSVVIGNPGVIHHSDHAVDLYVGFKCGEETNDS